MWLVCAPDAVLSQLSVLLLMASASSSSFSVGGTLCRVPGVHSHHTAQAAALMVIDGPTDPRLDSSTMSCLEPTPPTPLLVGAWPHADCGLDALTTTGEPLEPEVPDSGLPALDDTEAPPATFGCAGRVAGLLVLGGLLGGLRRRRSRVTPAGRPPGARP